MCIEFPLVIDHANVLIDHANVALNWDRHCGLSQHVKHHNVVAFVT